jgi:predicted phage tail protein
MPHIFIPSLLRNLTGGAADVRVAGATLREAIDALDAQYPGLKARLMDPAAKGCAKNWMKTAKCILSRP